MPTTGVNPYLSIPPELRALRRWTLHRVESVNGKKQKVPYQLNGQHASSTDPRTWANFSAVANVPKGFDGITYMLCASDGFVCIDLDSCRNPENGDVEPWAQAIITELDSYTEISPSGTGFHIFVKGKIPKASHKQGSRVEIYADKKPMAMTGRVLEVWEGGRGCASIEAPDISKLFALAEAGEFAPKNLQVKPPATDDESAKDWELIGELQRKVNVQDAAALEAEFAKAYPERYVARNREKGTRGGKTWFRYESETYLQKNPPKSQLGGVAVLDDPIIKEEDEPLPVFPKLPGPLGQLVEAITADFAYGHKALAAITYIGVGISGRVKLNSEPWLQPRFYSCMVGPPGAGKSAPDVEMRRALFDVIPHLLSGVRAELSIDSGPALVQALAEHPRMILVPDELADQFEKARATATGKASLFGEFLRLYEGNETANRTKFARGEGGLTEVKNAHFSILGSATTERFEKMWLGIGGAASGLQSRFVLSYSENKMSALKTPNDETALAAALFDLEKTVGFGEAVPVVWGINLSVGAQNELEDWGTFVEGGEAAEGLPAERRIVDMAKRFALVLAACSGATEIDLETMRLGVDFAEYQVALRNGLFPEDASSFVQAFENRILKFYQRHALATERDVVRNLKPERYPGGFSAFNQALAALLRAGKLKPVGKTRKGNSIFELD